MNPDIYIYVIPGDVLTFLEISVSRESGKNEEDPNAYFSVNSGYHGSSDDLFAGVQEGEFSTPCVLLIQTI